MANRLWRVHLGGFGDDRVALKGLVASALVVSHVRRRMACASMLLVLVAAEWTQAPDRLSVMASPNHPRPVASPPAEAPRLGVNREPRQRRAVHIGDHASRGIAGLTLEETPPYV